MKNKLRLAVLILLLIKCDIKAQTWSPVGSGTDVDVYVMLTDTVNKMLYAGGDFITAGGDTVNYIAKWDGASWSAMGDGMDATVYAMTMYNGVLYVGGAFTEADGVTVDNIAKWDGTAWSAVGASGADGYIDALVVSNGVLYAGGYFTTIGGVPANNIAKWNGTTWSALGSGTNSDIYALSEYNGDIYAGGYFDSVGVVPANRIAKWNGSIWSAIGGGVTGSYAGVPEAEVYALATYNGDLYVGGYFDTAGVAPANYIVKWNGTSWSSLGSGMDWEVYALAAYEGKLYVGGGFSMAGGNVANSIAKWDGSNWSPLGNGIIGNVWALSSIDGAVYAGGNYTIASGNAANNIAKWNLCPNNFASASANISICIGSSTVLSSSGGIAYSWMSSAGLNNTSIAHPVANPGSTTTYSVIVTDFNVCRDTVSVKITVNLLPTISITPNTTICNGINVNLSSSGGIAYSWMPSTGLNSVSVSGPVASPGNTTTYSVVVTDNNGCKNTASVKIVVNSLPTILATANTTICAGDNVNLSSSGGISCVWTPSAGLSSTDCSVVASPTVTTTYSLTVTGANGCSNNSSVTIAVNPLPPIPTISLNGSTLVSTSATSYQWMVNNLFILNGNSQTYTPTQNGNYVVNVTDANGCSSSSAPFAVTGVGISELINPDSIILYPNPTDGILNVAYSFTKNSDLIIKIMNVNGQIIYTQNLKSFVGEYKHSIDMTPYAKGIYCIQIITAGETITKKITFQ